MANQSKRPISLSFHYFLFLDEFTGSSVNFVSNATWVLLGGFQSGLDLYFSHMSCTDCMIRTYQKASQLTWIPHKGPVCWGLFCYNFFFSYTAPMNAVLVMLLNK